VRRAGRGGRARARANLPSLVTDSISAVSVADRFVRSGAPAALLATSPARTLDAAARRDATRFVAATAAASSPDTALALSDAPFERARALLETARARQKNAAMKLRPEARAALGEACRAVTRLASAAAAADSSSASCTLRARVFELARLAVAAGGEDDVTLCETLLLPAVRQFRDASLTPPECRDALARATLAARAPACAPVGDESLSFSESTTDDMSSFVTAASASASTLRLARLWRERAEKTRRRRGSEKNGGSERVDDLAAMRGAGAWAARLALARGSASLRSEAAELLRRLAADSARARFAALGALVRAFDTIDARGEKGGQSSSLAFFDLLESLLSTRYDDDGERAFFSGVFGDELSGERPPRDETSALSALGAPRAERYLDTDGIDPVAARFLGARGFVRRALERIARDAAWLRSADLGGRDAPAADASATLARLADLVAALLDASAFTPRLTPIGSATSPLADALSSDARPFGSRSELGSEDRLLFDVPTSKESNESASRRSRDARFAAAALAAFPRGAATSAPRLALDASLAAASLVRARTPETAIAAASLASLVDRVAFSGGEEGLAAAIDAAVKALRRVAGLEPHSLEDEDACAFSPRRFRRATRSPRWRASRFPPSRRRTTRRRRSKCAWSRRRRRRSLSAGA
jgi:hypothetical protein